MLSLTALNKIFLIFFILAKICGLVGIAAGFIHGSSREVGGILLGTSFVFLLVSIVCSIVQMSIDRKKFEDEDEYKSNLKLLLRRKKEIENELLALQQKKDDILLSLVRSDSKL